MADARFKQSSRLHPSETIYWIHAVEILQRIVKGSISSARVPSGS
jgi:hypothetical protein